MFFLTIDLTLSYVKVIRQRILIVDTIHFTSCWSLIPPTVIVTKKTY